jgi:hypothetical protein
MARYLVFGRHAYAEPLELVGAVEADGTPTVETAGAGADWLELVVLPEADVIWVVRDAALVEERKGVPA